MEESATKEETPENRANEEQPELTEDEVGESTFYTANETNPEEFDKAQIDKEEESEEVKNGMESDEDDKSMKMEERKEEEEEDEKPKISQTEGQNELEKDEEQPKNEEERMEVRTKEEGKEEEGEHNVEIQQDDAEEEKGPNEDEPMEIAAETSQQNLGIMESREKKPSEATEIQNQKTEQEEPEKQRKRKKSSSGEDEGEIESDHEDKGKAENRKRKKPEEREEVVDESKTKKAALERLRNMRFAAKDPFKENPPRDGGKFSLLSSRTIRDRTPPPRKSVEDTRSRDREPANNRTSSNKRRRSRSPRFQRQSGNKHDNNNSSASIIESRHMRGTMYLLQAEQKAAMTSSSSISTQKSRSGPQVGTKPLRERLECMLARPDHEVLMMPIAELKSMILNGIELFADQEHFLSGRKAQLIELDSMISQEREAIERISKELPAQYRPPIFEEITPPALHPPVDGQSTMGQRPPHFIPQFPPPTQNQPNFTLPPPQFSQNIPHEFYGSDFMYHHPPFMRPPMPMPIPPQSSGQFGHTPSLLFTKPPPTSTPSEFNANKNTAVMSGQQQINQQNVQPNSSDFSQMIVGEPPQLKGTQTTKMAPVSLASIPPLSRPPPNFASNSPQQQQQMARQDQQQSSNTSIGQTTTNPQLVISNTLKNIHSATPPKSNLNRSSPSKHLGGSNQSNQQQKTFNPTQSPQQQQQTIGMNSNTQHQQPQQVVAQQQQTPRPLMSLSIGPPPQPQGMMQPQQQPPPQPHHAQPQVAHPHIRQTGPSPMRRTQQFPGSQSQSSGGNAEPAQAGIRRGGRGGLRRMKPMGRGGGRGGGGSRMKPMGGRAVERRTTGRGGHPQQPSRPDNSSPPTTSTAPMTAKRSDWGNGSPQAVSSTSASVSGGATATETGRLAEKQQPTTSVTSAMHQTPKASIAVSQTVVQAADTTTTPTTVDEEALPISP